MFADIRSRVLRGCRLLIKAIKSDQQWPGTRVDFPKKGSHMDGTEYLQGLGHSGFWRGRITEQQTNVSDLRQRSSNGVPNRRGQQL